MPVRSAVGAEAIISRLNFVKAIFEVDQRSVRGTRSLTSRHFREFGWTTPDKVLGLKALIWKKLRGDELPHPSPDNLNEQLESLLKFRVGTQQGLYLLVESKEGMIEIDDLVTLQAVLPSLQCFTMGKVKQGEREAFVIPEVDLQTAIEELYRQCYMQAQQNNEQAAVALAENAKPRQAGPSVFISYSRADSIYLEKLKIHLEPIVWKGLIPSWDDTQIKAGMDWQTEMQTEIQQALADVKVAILLVSARFFASKFQAINPTSSTLVTLDKMSVAEQEEVYAKVADFVEESIE